MEFKFIGVLGIKLCDVLFVNMQRKKDQNVTNVAKPIIKEEYDGLQYLSGYVVQKILKKASKGKQNKENNAIMNILSSAITDQFEEQTLINVQTRGGLTNVKKEGQSIFIKAEEEFRMETASNSVAYDI